MIPSFGPQLADDIQLQFHSLELISVAMSEIDKRDQCTKAFQ